MRRSVIQAILLGLFVAVTLPPLIVLCRGRSPSRFSTVNLPTWERKAPRPAHAKVTLRLRPLPPGNVQFSKSIVQTFLRVDENRLLAQIESPPRHPTLAAGSAGVWLENTCALGRKSHLLAAKQDRVALRLMTAEDTDGYLAAGREQYRWSASQSIAESRNLRGLLAYFAITHHVASIDAAMQAGDLIAIDPKLAAPIPRLAFSPLGYLIKSKTPSPQAAPLVLPMTRLYLMTGQPRYLRWAASQAKAGQADIPGLCALYLATGKVSFLQQAQRAWKRSTERSKTNPDAAACLLAIGGAPGYAQVVRRDPAPWPCLLSAGSLAYAQTPHGLSVNVWGNTHAVWKNLYWTQQTVTLPNGLIQTTIAMTQKQPVNASIGFPIAGERVTASINARPLTIAPGQATLTVTRVWRLGDRLTLTASPNSQTHQSQQTRLVLPRQKHL